MAQSLKRGDKIRWNTSQGETHSRFAKKQTSRP
jgi:hypothetical protein